VTQLLGISGSLRTGSYNTALLRAAQQGAGPELQVEIATLHGIPLYDGDLEATSGVPAAVKELKQRIIASDGVLLATPEYNGGIPGVMKNAIDWLSRPGTDIPKVFRGRPFALLGATPGGFGTVLSQNAWLPILKQLGVQLWSGGRIVLSHAPNVLDAGGKITDETTLKLVTGFVQGFAAFAAQARAKVEK
jgi:chromate reductase, NAD(P)H dehydrogenase (quinone)